MKLKNILMTGAVALMAQSAFAGTPTYINYQDGDLMIGFRTVGGANAYVLDIGSPSTLTSATPGQVINLTSTLSLGDIATDLSSTFGTSWYSSTVQWALIGATDGGDSYGLFPNTVFTSNPTTSLFPNLGDNQSGLANTIVNGLGFSLYAFSTANSPVGQVQGSNVPNSYSTFQPIPGANPPNPNNMGISFATWQTNEAGATSSLYINEIFTPNDGGNGVTVNLGTIAMSGTDGQIMFTAAPAAVPEPSTYAMLGLGGLGLLGMLRRRSIKA